MHRKRRFRLGVELAEDDLHAQDWVRGVLQFERDRLYLCHSTPGHLPPPYGVLYRPTLSRRSVGRAGLVLRGGQLARRRLTARATSPVPTVPRETGQAPPLRTATATLPRGE